VPRHGNGRKELNWRLKTRLERKAAVISLDRTIAAVGQQKKTMRAENRLKGNDESLPKSAPFVLF